MLSKILNLISRHQRTFKSVGMIASANLFGTITGIVGSLVQARFITPEDLGFVRKFSVISNYSVFLSLGLFIILQREYSVLIGRGEQEKAYKVASIVQTWCLAMASIVCGALLIVSFSQLAVGNWREACAWFIQVVVVWANLYGGYLACTFRSGHEFERLAKGNFMSSFVGVLMLPLFLVTPFAGLVLRSIGGTIVSSVYLHWTRPLKIRCQFHFREFFDLVKRGMRLFAGDYLRYQFWAALEIWLMLRFCGDSGVGHLVFSMMIVESLSQISVSLNQIYVPRLAHHYGQTGSLRECLSLSIKPTLLSTATAVVLSLMVWLLFPKVLVFAFPKYVAALPMLNILLLNTIIVALSLPLYSIALVENYQGYLAAAIAGLSVFIGISFGLRSLGLYTTAVAWGSIAGRSVFVMCLYLCLLSSVRKMTPADEVEYVN